MAIEQRQEIQAPEPAGCLPALLRFAWMVLGNLALLFCAAFVAKGTATVAMDILFFAVAIGLIVIRYVDIAKFKGETSDSKPATLAHWRRYAGLVVVISTGLWALARYAASHGGI
jgi:hypothetical protein